jgi:diguanylate cyclase
LVLTQLGAVLLRTCRGVDFVARVGGEEFAIILPDCGASYALDIGERVRKAVESHLFILPDGKKINITVSIGVACYPDSAEDIYMIKKQADEALYRAKHEGRNRVCMNDFLIQ